MTPYSNLPEWPTASADVEAELESMTAPEALSEVPEDWPSLDVQRRILQRETGCGALTAHIAVCRLHTVLFEMR